MAGMDRLVAELRKSLPHISDSLLRTLADIISALNQYDGDVRCIAAGSGFNSTTSYASGEVRGLAADAVFRQAFPYNQRSILRLFSGTVTVTYADGGKEQFRITTPMSSNPTGLSPIPGSLVMGSGVVESTSCG
jgi:hypothetical protein